MAADAQPSAASAAPAAAAGRRADLALGGVVSPGPRPPSRPVPVAPPGGYRTDPVLFAVVLLLTGLGLVMVYSSSAIYAQQHFGDSRYFLVRDIVWVLLGLVAMSITMRIDYHEYRRWAYPLLGLTVLMLVAVLVVGSRVNGAKRWFRLGGLSFQPAELAKLALVVYLAHSLTKKAEKLRLFGTGFLPHLVVCGAFMLLLLKQPDLGTAVIMGGVTLILLFIAGTNISYLLIALLGATPILYHAVVGTPWRLRRILAFLDPWQFRADYGYQMAASLIAIGSGGVGGVGLGDSRQKLFFLPEAHTDYIVAIIGEELGLVGVGAVILMFLTLAVRGYQAAYRARDSFGCYLAAGITTMIGLQAAINLGVVMGSLPTKGLPLPFVSNGGSTLVVDLMAFGVLLNVSRGEPAPSPIQTERARTKGPLSWLLPGRKNRRLPGGGRRVVIEKKRARLTATRPDAAEPVTA